MAKNIIIGVENGKYKDKQSGEEVPYIVLHIVKRNLRTAGICSEQVRIYDGHPAYNYILSFCMNDLTQLVNRYVSIERGGKGYLENIDFGDKADDAVLIEV